MDFPPNVTGVLASIAAAAVVGGGAMVLKNSERVAVLESQYAAQERRLERIEQKVDVVIERLPERPPNDEPRD